MSIDDWIYFSSGGHAMPSGYTFSRAFVAGLDNFFEGYTNISPLHKNLEFYFTDAKISQFVEILCCMGLVEPMYRTPCTGECSYKRRNRE